MARPAGLEPTTPWFVESSTKCLYSRCFWRVRCATNVHPCPRALNKVAQKSRTDYLLLRPHLGLDYEVIVARDATGARMGDLHEPALHNIASRYAAVKTVAEITGLTR